MKPETVATYLDSKNWKFTDEQFSDLKSILYDIQSGGEIIDKVTLLKFTKSNPELLQIFTDNEFDSLFDEITVRGILDDNEVMFQPDDY